MLLVDRLLLGDTLLDCAATTNPSLLLTVYSSYLLLPGCMLADGARHPQAFNALIAGRKHWFVMRDKRDAALVGDVQVVDFTCGTRAAHVRYTCGTALALNKK